MDENVVITAVSYYDKKYYFNEACKDMPGGVAKEILNLCKIGAEMTQGVFFISYNNDGGIIFSVKGAEDDHNFDDIGARLITDKLAKENTELINSLQLWHALTRTEKGVNLKKRLEKTNERRETDASRD